MIHKFVCGALVAILAVAAGGAHAASEQNASWYASIDLARSNLGMSGGGVDGQLANQGIAGTASISNQDTSAALNLGYRFSKSLALEGGYIDLGKYNYASLVTVPAADTIQGAYKARAFSLTALGMVPLGNKWSLVGKAGLTRLTTEFTAASLSGATTLADVSKSNFGYLLGVGMMYDLAANWFARASLDRYAHIGDPSGDGRRGISVFSLGMGVRF